MSYVIFKLQSPAAYESKSEVDCDKLFANELKALNHLCALYKCEMTKPSFGFSEDEANPYHGDHSFTIKIRFTFEFAYSLIISAAIMTLEHYYSYKIIDEWLEDE